MSTIVSPSMDELVSADVAVDDMSSADGTQGAIVQLAISRECTYIYIPTVTKL